MPARSACVTAHALVPAASFKASAARMTAYQCSLEWAGNRCGIGTRNASSRWTILSWFLAWEAHRKFPPKTIESTGVATAWIHPAGMIKVSPACNSSLETAPGGATLAKVTEDCEAREDHLLKAAKFSFVGPATYITLAPESTWYQTLVPPKSTWKSVKHPPVDIKQYFSTRGLARSCSSSTTAGLRRFVRGAESGDADAGTLTAGTTPRFRVARRPSDGASSSAAAASSSGASSASSSGASDASSASVAPAFSSMASTSSSSSPWSSSPSSFSNVIKPFPRSFITSARVPPSRSTSPTTTAAL
mmetsp:Transcript_246/g.895  ORF Transcript_246/g.895 Transcript_246/m.895 type:complete len:304 (+) Transcript_246:682-1593(+)